MDLQNAFYSLHMAVEACDTQGRSPRAQVALWVCKHMAAWREGLGALEPGAGVGHCV